MSLSFWRREFKTTHGRKKMKQNVKMSMIRGTFLLTIAASCFVSQTESLPSSPSSNDHPPVFSRRVYTKEVTENVAGSLSHILKVEATDPDGDHVTYRLADDTVSDTFGVSSATGLIYLRKNLDREKKAEYAFSVMATDGGVVPRCAIVKVIIKVKDVNDNAPVFSKEQYHFHVVENMKLGSLIGVAMATDLDDGPNGQLRYRLFMYDTDMIPFAINPDNGAITTLYPLDREMREMYDLTVEASDQARSYAERNVAMARVRVIVKDVNDNAPVILYPLKDNLTVENDTPKGTTVLRILAYDRDSGINGKLTYSLTGNDPGVRGLFNIDPETGIITTRENLDSVEKKDYGLLVVVQDSGIPVRSSTMYVTVQVVESHNEKAEQQVPVEERKFTKGVDRREGTSYMLITLNQSPENEAKD